MCAPRTLPPPDSSTARQAGIVSAFRLAWQSKDLAALIGLLDPDATARADSGGLATARLRPLVGGAQIARSLIDAVGRMADLTIVERTVNGQPGLVAQRNGTVVTVYAFDIGGGRITQIWGIRNPQKLLPWTTG